MLTPTDVHYLVGLLTLSAEPDGVEIELGSMVMDMASEEVRDVDVTVTARNLDHSILGVAGVEVKAHARPLDSTHVEQLACKLKDMPSLTRRAIVSASGYFGPAIRKAEKHGIDLLLLKDWDQRSDTFPHFRSEFVPFVVSGLEWVDNVNVHVNPRNRVAEADRAFIQANPLIWQTDETPLPNSPDFNTFLRLMQRQAAAQLMERWKPAVIDENEIKKTRVAVQITDQPFVKIAGRRIVIEELVFEGKIRWRQEQRETKYKVLQRVGDKESLAGCCVFEPPGWGLCGLIVSNANRDIRFIHVPITERNLKKILRRPVLSRSALELKVE
jgi:hypothetical protein